MFRLQQLKYFVTAVEKGSLNKAASTLYISQSALTKQLARLEDELACRLMIRKPTGIETTEAGNYLYERARIMIAQAEETLEGMKQYASRPHIRIGALPSLAGYYLPDTIHPLQTEGTYTFDITVRDTTDELTSMLEKGELDVAFVQDFTEHASLSSLFLFDEPYMAVLPVSHPLAAREVLSFSELSGEKWVLHRDPCDIRTSFRHHCSQVGIDPPVALELNFNESLLPFIAKGYGISITPGIVAPHIHDPLLVTKDIASDPFYRTISAVFHPKAEKQVRALLA
jgi:DNA-binding transcriptional LysR family regulator